MLSESKRGQIIGAYISIKNIRQVSRSLNLPLATVHYWVKRFQESNSIIRASGSGRKRKTTKRGDRRLFRLARKHPFFSSPELLTNWNESVCPQTVRNRLRELNLKQYRSCRVPMLNVRHEELRLQWAMQRCHWRNQWKRVIWSDESRFMLHSTDRRRLVWRLPGERLDKRFVTKVKQGGGGSVHVWGAIWSGGRSELIRLHGFVNMVSYCDLLHGFFTTNNFTFNHIFQQDNAPAHTGWQTLQMLDDIGVNLLPWPAQLADLNPIEHVWDILGRKVRHHTPTSLDHLFSILHEEWHAIPQERIDSLIDSMTRRVGAVISKRGGHTQY